MPFVTSLERVSDEGSSPDIVQYGSSSDLRLNVFTSSKVHRLYNVYII